jgi:hypothetical protein
MLTAIKNTKELPTRNLANIGLIIFFHQWLKLMYDLKWTRKKWDNKRKYKRTERKIDMYKDTERQMGTKK